MKRIPAASDLEFSVRLAPSFRAEQEYILSVVLGEFLGLVFRITEPPSARPAVTITGAGKTLHLPQVLFSGNDRQGLVPTHPRPSCLRLPVLSEHLPRERFGGEDIPVIYGQPGSTGRWISGNEQSLTLHADVLGSSFFMLTRLEEVGCPAADAHGCFPPQSTLAHAEGFLRRPIVDEYTELLWLSMRRLWPNLCRGERKFEVRVSHDVDRPMAYDYPALRDRVWSVRQHAQIGTLPRLWGSRSLNAAAAIARLPHHDPFANFEWLLSADDGHRLRTTYYFLAGGDTEYDGRYDISASRIRRLLRLIDSRKHEIGLHGSYATIDDSVRLRDERRRLAQVLEDEGLRADVRSVRQHYLRWKAPDTWRAAEAAGFSIDASVGFNEMAGFRSGTSFEHRVFDVEARRSIRLRERPLHIMDRALGGVDYDESLEMIDTIRQGVVRHGGSLELLWHNNTFTEGDVEWLRYEHAIAPEDVADVAQ